MPIRKKRSTSRIEKKKARIVRTEKKVGKASNSSNSPLPQRQEFVILLNSLDARPHGKTKRRISRTEFERKVKIWNVLIPLIIGVITSITTIASVYFSTKSKVEYKIPENEQIEVNRLAAQIKVLSNQYYKTNSPAEKESLAAQLQILAEAEASFMRKYNPNYQSRWPVAELKTSDEEVGRAIFLIVVYGFAFFLFMIIFFLFTELPALLKKLPALFKKLATRIVAAAYEIE